MKFLIIGATGLLGSKILEYLNSKGYRVYGTCFSNYTKELIKMNITDKNRVFEVINEIQPDVIIHSAAVVNPDYCEENREEAYNVNFVGTQNIVESAKEIGAKIVYISTDAVFDNSNKAYTEKDETSPINYYAETKLMGEKAVQNSGLDFIISRITGLYGYSKYYNKIGFPTWIINGIKSGEKLKVVDGMRAHPTLIDDVSKVIFELINKDQSGIFHMTGPDFVTRLEFAYKVCEIFELNNQNIIPVKQEAIGFKARRGENLHISLEKINKLGIKTIGINEGLKIMKEQMENE